jgi:drug/metabolite transporter (DMT)-like permease
MNKAWVGYLSSILLIVAGVLMIFAERLLLGILFIVLAVVGLALKIYINKQSK